MKKLYYLTVTSFMLLVLSGNLLAQQPPADTSNNSNVYDSITNNPLNFTEVGYVRSKKKIPSAKSAKKILTLAQKKNDVKAEAQALLVLGDAYIAYGSNDKALAYLTNCLKQKSVLNEREVSHLYYNLAIVLSRLKQYAFALKCYFKTENIYQQTVFKRKRRQIYVVDTAASTKRLLDGKPNPFFNDSLTVKLFSDELVDETIINTDTTGMLNNPILPESPYDDYGNIIDNFKDGKKAIAYGILLHVKQPVPGKSTVFAQLSKVGHTFITLTKFNADSTDVSRTFGFYPEKDNLLSATPLMPATNSTIRNDRLHDWDETIGKFITEDSFEKILQLINENGSKRYNLNRNNCTDFALKIAGLANIKIEDTNGFWPLGGGNNPGSTGQSILKGKYKNTDSNNEHGLFACSNNLFIHLPAGQ